MNSKRINRLVSLANLADDAGWHKEATFADGIAKEALEEKSLIMPSPDGMCPDCDRPLGRALWSKDYNYKTCPHCSVNAGEHIFYPLDKFLNREEGKGPESWCRGCAWYGKDKGGGLSVFTPANIDCSSGIPHNKVPRDKKISGGKEQENLIWTKLINEFAPGSMVVHNAAFYPEYGGLNGKEPQLGDMVKHQTHGEGMVVKVMNKDGRKQIGIIFDPELIQVLKQDEPKPESYKAKFD